MIEKLEPIKEFDCSDTPQAKMQHHSYHNDCIKKINELVDAVNALVYENDKDSDWYDDTKHREQPADPYAEQRKWIGKLCWVWDEDGDERTFAKLNEIIEDDDRPFKCFTRWKHCEPVKPDDNIIYKGE